MMIYVECNADSMLVKTLGVPRKKINHCGGKAKVCKLLGKKEDCKGLVDEDPFSVQPPYLKKLQVKENLSSFGLRILNDKLSNNDLIILSPRLEEWILDATKEAQMDIQDYDLPADGDQLHKNMNLSKLGKLIEDLKEKSERVKVLRNFLIG